MAQLSKALQKKLMAPIDGKPVSIWIKVEDIDFDNKTVTFAILATDQNGMVCVDMIEHELPEGHSMEVHDLRKGLTLKLEGSDKRLFDDE